MHWYCRSVTLLLASACLAACGGGGGSGGSSNPGGNSAPRSVIQAAPTSGTAPLQVDFDGSGSTDPDGAIASYQWRFGDGTSPEQGAQVAHTFQQAGSYQVELIVTDAGGLSDSALLTIVASDPVPGNDPPVAAFATTPMTLQATGEPFDFDASASTDPDGTITRYAWQFGDGATATGVTTQHSYSSSGQFTVTLTVTDDDGATDTATQTADVGERPLAEFTFAPTTQIASFPVELDAAASGDGDGQILEYRWDFGDGSTATETDPQTTKTYAQTGDYPISLVVVDDDGLESAPAMGQQDMVTIVDPFRDGFDTNTLGDYTIQSGSGATTYDAVNERMSISSPSGNTVRVFRDLVGLEQALFQLRFLPTAWNGSSNLFVLFLRQDADNYYRIEGRGVNSAGSPGSIQKVVGGTQVASANFTPKYQLNVAHSINVYFSPSRLTVEFPTSGPRVKSILDAGDTALQINEFEFEVSQQDASIDDISMTPAQDDFLDYYVAYGDSLTEGTNDLPPPMDGRGYPILLQNELFADMNSSQVVFNEGFGGMRTLEASTRITEVLDRHPEAEFFTILIGTNDALQVQQDPLSATDYKDLLAQIVADVRARGKQAYLAKLPPLSNAQADARAQQYNQAIDDLVGELNISVTPPDLYCYFDANPDPDFDGIHPGSLGYQAIGSLWFKMITSGGDACTLP